MRSLKQGRRVGGRRGGEIVTAEEEQKLGTFDEPGLGWLHCLRHRGAAACWDDCRAAPWHEAVLQRV